MSAVDLGQRDARFHLLESLFSDLEVTVDRERLWRGLGARASLESVGGLLRQVGVSARSVTLHERDLQYIRTPALVEFDDGFTLLVDQVRGNVANVRHFDGGAVARETVTIPHVVANALELGGVDAQSRRAAEFLRSALKGHGGAWLMVTGISLALAGLGAVGPAITGAVLDGALPSGAKSFLMALASAMLLLEVQRAWLGWLRAKVLRGVDGKLRNDTVRGAFAALLRMPFQRAMAKSTGDLLQAAGSAEALAGVVTGLSAALIIDVVMIVVWIGALGLVSPMLAVFTFVGATVNAIATSVLAVRMASLQGQELDSQALARSALVELLTGIHELKAARTERHAVARWLTPTVRAVSASHDRASITAWHGLSTGAISTAVRASVLVIGGQAIFAGSMTVGSFLMAAMFVDSILGASSRVSGALMPLWSARCHYERLNELLEMATPPERRREESLDADAIVLKDVWFRYGPNEPWILKGYNLRVPRGTHFTLRGASGAGKSTVLRLIAGLVEPEKGTVSVFGRPPHAHESEIAYLPQSASLFAGSILHNLALLSGDARELLEDAAGRTGLLAWVRSLPMGLETVLPPGGRNLSGGQRQLIAMTGAVAATRSIVLLDESTSQMDRVTRARVERVKPFLGRTVVEVSHVAGGDDA